MTRKSLEKIILIIGIIIAINIAINISINIFTYVYSFTKNKLDEKNREQEITENAIAYFTGKYGISKEDITIKSNHFYGENERCWNVCGENIMNIEYNGDEYSIVYDLDNDSYTDNYQDTNAMYKILHEKLPFASKLTVYSSDNESNEKNPYHVFVYFISNNEEIAKDKMETYAYNTISTLKELNVTYSIYFSQTEYTADGNYYYSYSYEWPNDTLFEFKDMINQNKTKCLINEYINTGQCIEDPSNN